MSNKLYTKEEFESLYDKENTLRVLVVRKGAIGDVLMVTPVIRQIAQGYSRQPDTKVVVDFYGRPHGTEILKNNPYVDRVFVYDMGLKGPELDERAAREQEFYDLYDGVVEMHMTIEGRYLFRTDGRYGIKQLKTDPDVPWGESPARRQNAKGINYMDATMFQSGLEFSSGHNPEIYLDDKERAYLKEFNKKYQDKYVVMWQLMGSTGNKTVTPAMSYIKHMLDTCPESEHWIVGDQRLQKSPEIDSIERIHFTPGTWSLRQALVTTRAADLVVGPESMLVTAASAWDPMGTKDGKKVPQPNTDQRHTPVGKMMFFSHSLPENISTYWQDCDNIEPSTPCHPCYYIPVTHYYRKCLTDSRNSLSMFKCVATLPHEDIKNRLTERYEKWARLHLPKLEV